MNAVGVSYKSGDGDRVTRITGSRVIYLDNRGDTRTDTVSDLSPNPRVDNGDLVVKGKKGSLITGTGRVAGGDLSERSFNCKVGKDTMRQHETGHAGSTWMSEHGMRFHESAFADLKFVDNEDGASWVQRTYS